MTAAGGQLRQIGEAQLRAVLDSIPARVSLLDRKRRHRYVNQEYVRFIGLDREKIIGRTVAEILGPAAFELIRAYGQRALAGETVRWSGWLPYSGGQGPRFVQRVYMPYRSEAGTIDGYLVFARDLTELKQSEEQLARQVAALHASEALNAAIIASALDCIVVIDEEGTVVEFNPAAERTFGYSRADALGRRIGDLIVPEHMRQRHADGFARYLETGVAKVLGRRLELEAMRADGGHFPVELTINEVQVPGRRLFTAMLRDLTAAREAAAELQRGRDALHQSEKMAAFGSLLAGVAHELNNPLAIVIGNALMLQEEAEEAQADPAFIERAERIQLAAERCGRIVRTFLAMARQRQVTRRPVEVGPLIEGALDLLGYGLRTHDIAVAVRVPPDGPCLAVGDPDQLSQVLTNLLVNAQQVLETRELPRRIEVELAADASWVTVRVADNGAGVPEAIRGRVFDPFFTTKPAGSGTGIGLAVSRGIAEAHGGSLTLSDAAGGGACFELRLPRAASPAPAQAVASAADRGRQPTRSAVLVVDDEPEVAAVLAGMLAKQGFRCDIASNGRQAQTLLLRQEYDAILCDLHMPELDGPALFEWMEAHTPALCARTAFVTGDMLGRNAEGFLVRAGRPVVEKPFQPAELRRVVQAIRRKPTR